MLEFSAVTENQTLISPVHSSPPLSKPETQYAATSSSQTFSAPSASSSLPSSLPSQFPSVPPLLSSQPPLHSPSSSSFSIINLLPSPSDPNSHSSADSQFSVQPSVSHSQGFTEPCGKYPQFSDPDADLSTDSSHDLSSNSHFSSCESGWKQPQKYSELVTVSII